ncbi:hypothetical protein Lal_00036367 [Lupinus albus]|nr:hypothetical protein Lal_00036367 [Lupinus albus]
MNNNDGDNLDNPEGDGEDLVREILREAINCNPSIDDAKENEDEAPVENGYREFNVSVSSPIPCPSSIGIWKHAKELAALGYSGENLIEDNSDESLVQKFENYWKAVESTVVWGGQLELGECFKLLLWSRLRLGAFTHCLKKHIMIFSGSFPDVEMGKEYKCEDGNGSSNLGIMLSYHKHAFGLGERYNSVVLMERRYNSVVLMERFDFTS